MRPKKIALLSLLTAGALALGAVPGNAQSAYPRRSTGSHEDFRGDQRHGYSSRDGHFDRHDRYFRGYGHSHGYYGPRYYGGYGPGYYRSYGPGYYPGYYPGYPVYGPDYYSYVAPLPVPRIVLPRIVLPLPPLPGFGWGHHGHGHH